MTKINFIENLSETLNLPKRQVAKVVQSVFDIIKEPLQREDKLIVSGFGDFIIRNKRARRGRNPHSGSDIVISPRRILTFRPSLVFKARLNQWKEKHIASAKASLL